MPLKAANAEKKTLHFPRAFAYGFGWLKDQPFQLLGLLCEVDQPGEWHYDPTSQKLYFIPPIPVNEIESIGLPIANGFLELHGTKHVSIIGITLTSFSSVA